MLLFQILYFLVVGWWLGALAAALAYLMIGSVILLPLGVMILNRLPSIMYFKNTGEACEYGHPHHHEREEFPFILRVLWFFLVGWNFGLALLGIAYFFMLTIIGMPIGIYLLNRVPIVLTLSRNYD